jgi:hypothetical protein
MPLVISLFVTLCSVNLATAVSNSSKFQASKFETAPRQKYFMEILTPFQEPTEQGTAIPFHILPIFSCPVALSIGAKLPTWMKNDTECVRKQTFVCPHLTVFPGRSVSA